MSLGLESSRIHPLQGMLVCWSQIAGIDAEVMPGQWEYQLVPGPDAGVVSSSMVIEMVIDIFPESKYADLDLVTSWCHS